MFENFPKIKKVANEALERGIKVENINEETGEVTINGNTVSGETFMEARENADTSLDMETTPDGTVVTKMSPEERGEQKEAFFDQTS